MHCGDQKIGILGIFIRENWKKLQKNCKTFKTAKSKKEKEKETWLQYLVWHLGVE